MPGEHVQPAPPPTKDELAEEAQLHEELVQAAKAIQDAVDKEAAEALRTPTPSIEPYPEHAKLREVVDISQALGEFLEEWLPTKGIVLASTRHEDSERLWPIHTPTRDLLAEFFGIDREKLEAEKDAMLDALREAQA